VAEAISKGCPVLFIMKYAIQAITIRTLHKLRPKLRIEKAKSMRRIVVINVSIGKYFISLSFV
jgi:hypothetical protein